MTKQIRRVSGLMLVLFAALFANLNVVQLIRAEELANHEANRRLIIREYQINRGPIIVADEPVARSVATPGDLKYRREYAHPTRYAHLMGYYSFVLHRAGLERAMNTHLTGTPTNVLAQSLAELLGHRDQVGNLVTLAIDPRVQAEAERALGDRTGAVLAIDPLSGAVLAHYSNPSYDPGRLSSHDARDIQTYWAQLNADPRRPLLDRAIRENFWPGSSFKIVVAAAALERGIDLGTLFDDTPTYQPPGTTRTIGNYGGGTCAGGDPISLTVAFERSCNTVFARLGVEVGADALISQSERFGLNRRIPYELTVVESRIPKELDPPATAQSAIGMRDVRTTPMQMAVISAAIANGGVLLRPHVVAEVLDPTGRPLAGPQEGPWIDGPLTAQAISPETARALFDLMVGAVERGTGRAAAIPGHVVGGKTGTADPEVERDGEPVTPTVWFVGFAATEQGEGADARVVPRVAVAVVMPEAGVGATGGADAAPVARAVMEAVLGLR